MRLAVFWQTLVVKGYRRFFFELALLMGGEKDEMHLLLPEKSLELGLRLVPAEAFDHEEKKVFRSVEILPVKIFHVQAFFARQLKASFRRIFGGDAAVKNVAMLFAEPYSLTAIWLYLNLQWISPRPKPFVLLYALQNIHKRDPLPLRLIEKYLYRRVDGICSLGPEQTQVLRAKGYEGPIIDFPLWYDASLFFPSLEVFGGPIKIGYAGSFTEEKGIPDLNEALNGLDLKDAINFYAAGTGPCSFDLRHPKVLFQPSEHYGLKAMGQFFRSLDILVVPSRTMPHWKEQFGRVIVEAKACGVTVIGSNSGAIPHVIDDDERIFREGDPESLRQYLGHWIKKLREDSPFRQSVRLANAASVVEKYSAKACARHFFTALEELVEEPPVKKVSSGSPC